MSERAATTIVDRHEAESRWAQVDLIAASTRLALSAACFATVIFAFIRGAAGKTVHPDAILLPLAFAIAPAVAGGFFLLARTAMPRRTTARWIVQWGAVLASLIFAAFVWLSL